MNFSTSIKTVMHIGRLVYLNAKPCSKCQRLINKISKTRITQVSSLFSTFPTDEQIEEKQPLLLDKEEFIEKYEPLFRMRYNKHYILDKGIADQIAEIIQQNRENKDNTLILIDSGPGHIVQAFLERGANKIMCLENNKKFLPFLEKLRKGAPEKFLSVSAQTHLNLYFTSWLYLVQDVREVLRGIPTHDWEDVPPLSMFIVLKYSRKQVLKFYTIIEKLVMKLSIYSLGRSEVFIVIDSAAYKSLNHKIDGKGNLTFNKTLPILFRTLFDVQTLLKIPAATFYSQLKVKKPIIHKKYMVLGKEKLSHKDVHLMRFVPKKDLYTKVLQRESINKFKEFLQLLLFCKYTRLIPTMERRIPGCGINLIEMGFTMATITGKLNEDDYLKIFLAMREWSEYEGSPMEEELEKNPQQLFYEGVIQSEFDE